MRGDGTDTATGEVDTATGEVTVQTQPQER